jgi:hypothetical protein
MGKYDNYLTYPDGKPARNPEGKLIPLSGFGSDPTFHPEIQEQPLAVVVEEMLRLDITVPSELLIKAVAEIESLGNPVPDSILKELNKEYLLKDDGTPYRTADGAPMRLADFDNEPSLPTRNRTDKEIEDDIRELGLGDLLDEVIAEEKAIIVDKKSATRRGRHMVLTQRFDQALQFAHTLHRKQKRKGTDIPYISHLLGVCSLVLEHGGDEDQAIAALLHDAVEDQGDSYAGGVEQLRQDIEDKFGSTVLRIVNGCTDADTVPKPPWRARKEAYIAHIQNAGSDIRFVSCCDKLHNARAILTDYLAVRDDLWGRFNADKEDILWYYRSLADAFQVSDKSSLTEELSRVVSELEVVSG